jgi:hypothetical protein
MRFHCQTSVSIFHITFRNRCLSSLVINAVSTQCRALHEHYRFSGGIVTCRNGGRLFRENCDQLFFIKDKTFQTIPCKNDTISLGTVEVKRQKQDLYIHFPKLLLCLGEIRKRLDMIKETGKSFLSTLAWLTWEGWVASGLPQYYVSQWHIKASAFLKFPPH